MFQDCKNTKEQGNFGVGYAISYFTSNRYIVSIPLNDSQEYDLIVGKDNVLYKVQVKTTRYKKRNTINEWYVVLLKTCGGNQNWSGVSKKFDNSKIDILFILCENGDTYCIPTSKINAKNHLNLTKTYKEYKL